MASIIQGDKKELIERFKSDSEFRNDILKEAKEILKSKIESDNQYIDPAFNKDLEEIKIRKLAEYCDSISAQQQKESKGFFSKIASKLFDVDIPKSIEKSSEMSGIYELISSSNSSLTSKLKTENNYSRKRSNSESERAPALLSELENDEQIPTLKRQETLYSNFPQVIQGAENEKRPLPLDDLENEKNKPPLQKQSAKLNFKSNSEEQSQKPSIGKFTSNLNSEREAKQNSKDTMSIG